MVNIHDSLWASGIGSHFLRLHTWHCQTSLLFWQQLFLLYFPLFGKKLRFLRNYKSNLFQRLKRIWNILICHGLILLREIRVTIKIRCLLSYLRRRYQMNGPNEESDDPFHPRARNIRLVGTGNSIKSQPSCFDKSSRCY